MYVHTYIHTYVCTCMQYCVWTPVQWYTVQPVTVTECHLPTYSKYVHCSLHPSLSSPPTLPFLPLFSSLPSLLSSPLSPPLPSVFTSLPSHPSPLSLYTGQESCCHHCPCPPWRVQRQLDDEGTARLPHQQPLGRQAPAGDVCVQGGANAEPRRGHHW